jgi:hypothetical protein
MKRLLQDLLWVVKCFIALGGILAIISLWVNGCLEWQKPSSK